MPLQNRVTPYGEIVAVPARGLFMGNRGVLHDSDRRLGRRRWAVKYWLICRLAFRGRQRAVMARSEEHTSELQSLMRISYAVFCLKKKQTIQHNYGRHYALN